MLLRMQPTMMSINLIVLLVCLMPTSLIGYPQPAELFPDKIPENDQLAEPSVSRTVAVDLPAESHDDSDMYLEPDGEPQGVAEDAHAAASNHEQEPVAGSQNFFPLFSVYNNGNPPLGHSRPFIYHQEGAYSHRPYSARQNLNFDANSFRGFDEDFASSGKTVADSRSGGLLGSGNFGVIRGGTFYNQNDDISEYAGSNHHIFSPYYQNGHGRPSYYYNPKPTHHEQFANFRDFADINTPSNPAYSQYVVVYANKNSTRTDADIFEPKNINERLEMLDRETTTTDAPLKKSKLSASKRKLALLAPEKKPWGKKKIYSKTTTVSPKDLFEPLLALS